MEQRIKTSTITTRTLWGFIAIVLGSAIFLSCGKDSLGIPDVPVNYRVSVQEFNIKNKNGILVVNGHGVAGLIITKNSGAYLAFDRCSTVNPEARCAVIPDESGLTAVDTCSNGVFSLYDGAPMKAPAKKNLRQYSVYVTGGSLIQVSN
ncbi:hypothetical protein [Desertivirga brevis]|uniref:hypothetical protein n=1 Tax=Desertivirga brevis TaxID=2810310 RepID=UPI001A968352|nr:hypothetical protein [Pedobacter sp. SYSU D00873]